MKVFEKFKQFKQFSMLKVFNKNLGSSQRYTGFTLAEVLITLGIIGVVAALTIPTLINNYQNREYATSYKKAVATIEQAVKLYTSDNGGNLYQEDWIINSGGGGGKDENMYKSLKDHLKIIKTCMPWSGGDTDCFALNYKYMNSNSFTVDGDSIYYSVGLSDGMSMRFMPGDDGQDECYKDQFAPEFLTCVNQVLVDTNGRKKPNTLGKDLHTIYILGSGKVVPQDYNDSKSNIDTNCPPGKNSGLGSSCGAKIMMNEY